MIATAVYILHGCSVPLILRKQSDGQTLLVGEAYIHGIMDGEALNVRENEDILIAKSRIPNYTFSTPKFEKDLQASIEEVSEEKILEHEEPTPFLRLMKDLQDSEELSLHPQQFYSQQLDAFEPNFVCRKYQLRWKCVRQGSKYV